MIKAAISVLVLILVLITVINTLTARALTPQGEVSLPVAILIPMRNEERNAQACVESALAQEGLRNFKVNVLDDFSTDNTPEILANVSDSRFNLFRGTELPPGWLGKNFALHKLAASSVADYLVFLDADVRLHPKAIASAISQMEKEGLDYICPYPMQLAQSWLERLVQPLLQWSWFATLPLLVAARSLSPSTVVANGQLFIVRSLAYRSAGGHQSIKGEVLDDMELARSLRRNGSRGTVVDGSQIATCRMYQSATELRAGYLKSQWRAFGGTLGAFVAIKLMFWSSVAPLLLALAGRQLGWICYLALVTTRLLVAVKTKSSLWSAWFHPIAIAYWIYLILASIWLSKQNRLTWRGRSL